CSWKVDVSVGRVHGEAPDRVLAVVHVDEGGGIIDRIGARIGDAVVGGNQKITALGLAVCRKVNPSASRAGIRIVVSHPLAICSWKATFAGKPRGSLIVRTEGAVAGQRLEIGSEYIAITSNGYFSVAAAVLAVGF